MASQNFEQSSKTSYVVFAPAPDTFKGFVLGDARMTDPEVHNHIAKLESKTPSAEYFGAIKAGSFNFVRVQDAGDLDDAIDSAVAQGLTHEPMSVVYERSVEAEENRRETVAQEAAINEGLGDIVDGVVDVIEGVIKFGHEVDALFNGPRP